MSCVSGDLPTSTRWPGSDSAPSLPSSLSSSSSEFEDSERTGGPSEISWWATLSRAPCTALGSPSSSVLRKATSASRAGTLLCSSSPRKEGSGGRGLGGGAGRPLGSSSGLLVLFLRT